MNKLQTVFQSVVVDLCGAAFVATAVFGYITGRLSESALLTVTGLGAAYLGLKFPNPTGA